MQLLRPLRAPAALAALLWTLIATAGSAHAASPGGTYGVYSGSGKPSAVAAFAARTGRAPHRVHDFLARESWAAMTNVDWWTEQWSQTPYAQRMVFTIPMLPDSGGTLAAGATGAYNGHFQTLAAKLVAGGQGAATLRIGHEFNGDWFRWTIAVPGGARDYAAYWRQIVTTMRSVPGARFTFDWSPAAGSAWVGGRQLDAADAWPGDAYVDYVGLDIYDESWVPGRAGIDARWNGYLNERNGLRWHRDFAAAHGKPMTFPEWGVQHRTDGHGGGDAPEFIERMHGWIAANDVAYHLYFDFQDSGTYSRLFDGRFPRAAKRFRELFGPAGTAPPAAARAAAATGSAPTKLSISRARILPAARRLDLFAPITRLASGSARVELHAGGRRTSFSARIDSARGRVRVSRPIPPAQARPASGIVTITYGGNASTRPQEVRLRAASGKARLRVARPRIVAGRLRASGTVTRRARGVVRLQLVYDVDGRSVTRRFRAPIAGGRFRLDAPLPGAVRGELARREGSVHSYTLFTGYAPARIRGEMRSYQVLGGR